MKSYKQVKGEGTPENLVTSAISEIEEVKEELQNWMSNMEGTNLEQGEKYSALSEVVDTLEAVVFTEPDEWPHKLSVITYINHVPKRKNRTASRSVRLSNASMKIAAVADFYEGLDNGEEEYQGLLDELRKIVELEVEIPGMYG